VAVSVCIHLLVGRVIAARCPACGIGRLYQGLLRVAPACTHCGLDFSGQDAGDGPAFFAIVVVGCIITGLAVYVELAYEPAWWVHVLMWPIITLVLCLWVLRVVKTTLIHLQYRMKRLDTPDA
jgi:uncharacterized protein (DUF983 family)